MIKVLHFSSEASKVLKSAEWGLASSAGVERHKRAGPALLGTSWNRVAWRLSSVRQCHKTLTVGLNKLLCVWSTDGSLPFLGWVGNICTPSLCAQMLVQQKHHSWAG
jgi:hypothetical protein